jgi:FkbM family methyltransferase
VRKIVVIDGSIDPFQDQKSLMSGVGAPVIVDGGAHVGSSAVRYSHLFPEGKIYSFEPCKDTIKKFRDNLPNSRNVELVEAGLAEETGVKTLQLNGYGPTHSLLPRPENGKRYYPSDAVSVGEEQIDCIALDDFIRSREIDYIDILKLDVQGAELMVFDGAKTALEKEKIGIVFVETNFVRLYSQGALHFEVSERLSTYGYSLFRMYDFEYAKDGQLKFCNSLFLSDWKRKETLGLGDE